MAKPPPATPRRGPAAGDVDSPPTLFHAGTDAGGASFAPKPPPWRRSVHTLESNGGADPSRINSVGGFWQRVNTPGGVSDHRWHLVKELRHAAYKPPEQTDWRPGDPEIPPASDEELQYRHGWWWDERQAVLAGMSRVGEPPRRIEAVANCGSDC